MTEHLEKIHQIATAINYPELVTLAESVQLVVVHGAAPPHPSPPESNFSMIWDGVADWFHYLKPIESEVSLLHEAFYSIACSYDLARYVMWPIYREATPIEDPFAATFQLWVRGAEYRFQSATLLTVYAPEITE